MNAEPTLYPLPNGYAVRWSPTDDTLRVAVFEAITDDDVLQLEHICTIHRGVVAVATDVCACDVPQRCRNLLREHGAIPAKVRAAGRRAAAVCRRVAP